jgi:hypothetical protein
MTVCPSSNVAWLNIDPLRPRIVGGKSKKGGTSEGLVPHRNKTPSGSIVSARYGDDFMEEDRTDEDSILGLEAAAFDGFQSKRHSMQHQTIPKPRLESEM